ncbi:PHD finger protein 3, partial [Stegodyphus mimosarum]
MACEKTLATEAEYVRKKDEIQNVDDAGEVVRSIIGDITAGNIEPSVKCVENHGNLEKLASESCSTSESSNAEVVETTCDIFQGSARESLNIDLIFLEHSYAINPDCLTKEVEEDVAEEEATPFVKESKSQNVSLPVRRSQRQIEKLERELSEKVISTKDLLSEEHSSKPKMADLKLNITLEGKEHTENSISSSSPSSNLCDVSIFNGNFDKSKQQIKEEEKQEMVNNDHHLSSDLKTEVKSKLLEDEDVNNSLLLNKKTERLRKKKSTIADKSAVSEIKSELPRKTRSCRSRNLQLNKRCNKMTVERKRVVLDANESDLKSEKPEIRQNKRRRNSSKSTSSLVTDNELSSPEKNPTNQKVRKRNASASSVLGKISATKGASIEAVNCHKRKKCVSLSEDRVCLQNTESEIVEKKLSIEGKDLIQKYPKTASTPSPQKAVRQKKVLRRESLRFGLSENEPPLFSQPDVMVKVKSDDSPTKKDEKEKCDVSLVKKNEKKITVNSVFKKEEQEKTVSCYKKDDKEKNDLENKIRAICGEALISTDEKIVDKKIHLSEVPQTKEACDNQIITHNTQTENSCAKEPDMERTGICKGVIDNINESEVAPEIESLPPSPDCKNSTALKSVTEFALENESNDNEAELKATQESVLCMNDQKLPSSGLVQELPKPERKSRRLIKKKEFFEDILSKDSASSTTSKKSSTSQIKKSGDERQGVDDFKGKRKGRADSNSGKVKKTVAGAEESQPASDSSSEDDPEKLWCICRKPHNDRFMIQCDACEDWFHGSCVNVTRQLGRQLEKLNKEWKCPNCQQKEQMITLESKPSTENSSTSAVLQKMGVSEIKHVKIEESHKISTRKETASSTEIISAKSVPSKVNETNNNALMKSEPLTKKCDHIEERKKANKQGESSYHNGGIANVMTNMEHTLSVAKMKQASGTTDKSECKKDSLAKNETSSKSVGRKLSDKKNSINSAKQKVSKDVLKRKQVCVSCPKIASENSCYCSPNCIEKHVADCLKVMKETKGALKGAEFDAQRLVVFDRIKGNVIANDNGPTVGEIVSWLKSNPTFQIACSSPASNTKKSNSQKQNSDSSTTVPEKKDSNDESSKSTVRFNVRKTLKNILMDRCKNAEDIQMTEDEIRRIAVKIEEELHSLFKDNSFKYRAKYRSLMFNIKDPRNQGLFRKILKGNIPPDRLVRMSSEELASMELAKWREQENQHLLDMIKRVQLEQQKTGSGLLLKKTHKGEVEIEDDFTNIIE